MVGAATLSSRMSALHANFAWVVVAANLVVGVWGIVLWRTKRAASRTFWIPLGVAWAAIYAQGVLGLTMFQRCQPPFRHHFYGFLFVIITIIAFAMRGEAPSRRLFIFSALTLFIGIVAVRAVISGAPCLST